jgi:hypothetical protein
MLVVSPPATMDVIQDAYIDESKKKIPGRLRDPDRGGYFFRHI